MKEKNDAGFSLVELIVVIAIMTIVAVISVNLFSNTAGQQTKNAASLIGSYWNSTKNYNLTKNPSYLMISYDAAEGYSIADNQGNSRKLTGNLVISYETSTGDKKQITEGTPLRLSFNRSTGALLPIISSVEADGSFDYLSSGSGSATADYVYCSRITVTSGNSERSLITHRRTGKYEIE
jgi:prepilin-type N-terminal cleavage/methylation domain-containing protein